MGDAETKSKTSEQHELITIPQTDQYSPSSTTEQYDLYSSRLFSSLVTQRKMLRPVTVVKIQIREVRQPT
ncbi:hypothetical protein ACRALDRAFT_1061179 [Sodiomyces alcalophilus JCM 7366]|uniref:uncharacterized protein n=1 Tax=Sodiomyces alcalophilus JCM 7366 TaxID=591952 RepID=UPI0039B69572